MTVNFLTLFAGWFAGALIAETRVAQPAGGARRLALLVPRSLSGYLRSPARAAMPVALGLGVALAVTAVARRIGGADVHLATVAAWLAADDAIRSRSLHVLAGAGAVLVAYCGLGQLSGFDVGVERWTERTELIVVPAAAILGWWLSVQPWPVRRIRPDPVPVPASDPGAG